MLQPNDLLGPYIILEHLGSGQFGVVWKAKKQRGIAVPCALKLPTDPDLKWENVEKEAQVWLEASGHPNILPMIEADVYDGRIVIVSEYAAGGSLDKWLKSHGGKAPSIAKAIEIMLGILAGLEHLHGRNIVHRDLKPANVLLQGDIPRLADFGLSRVMSSTHHSNWSGTLEYSPPESFDDYYDNKTDIWAAGVLLYRLLSGRLPFPQGNQAALMGAIINKPPNPLPSDIPALLQQIVRKALEKKIADRYQSVVEMRQALLEANHIAISPKPIQPVPSPRRNIITIDFEQHYNQTPAPHRLVTEADDSPTRVVPAKPKPNHTPSPNKPNTETGPDRIVVVESYVKKRLLSDHSENLNGALPEMILVPAGKFMMGGDKFDDEKPIHEVRVPSFYIGKFQITQKQWQAVMGITIQQQRDKKDKNILLRGEGANYPMYYVSWHEAQEFCEKLRTMTGKAYRLPSEAEWEYACRARTTGDYAGKIDEMAWYGKDWNKGSTHPVGQKYPNAFGLYDMHGNVWEWCEDVWHDNYEEAPKDGSAWTDGGNSDRRVVRGGSWGVIVSDCRSAFRNYVDLGARLDNVGFRVVVSARTL